MASSHPFFLFIAYSTDKYMSPSFESTIFFLIKKKKKKLATDIMKSNFTLYCRHYQFTTTNYRNTNPNNKDNNDYKAFIFPLIMNK